MNSTKLNELYLPRMKHALSITNVEVGDRKIYSLNSVNSAGHSMMLVTRKTRYLWRHLSFHATKLELHVHLTGTISGIITPIIVVIVILCTRINYVICADIARR